MKIVICLSSLFALAIPFFTYSASMLPMPESRYCNELNGIPTTIDDTVVCQLSDDVILVKQQLRNIQKRQ